MIPARSLTVIVGPAGTGKTTFTMAQVAAITAGRMEGLEGPSSVLVSSLEDDPEAVLAPRLVAAGADLAHVHFVNGLALPSQVAALAEEARTLEAKAVVIDPIAAHLDPSIDSHRDASTRAALAPLADLGQDLDLAVLVVAHPNKGGGGGLDRISGSGAFGNAARSVIVFGLDPGDPEGETGSRRIIAHLKCNVARRASSLSAAIETTPVVTEDGEVEVPHLRVLGSSEHSADDVLASPSAEDRTDRDEARAFLADHLAEHPVRSREVKAAAAKAGLSWRTVQRAKSDLGLSAAKGPDGWYWLPPGQDSL
jgi:putative DNA primase/helicase